MPLLLLLLGCVYDVGGIAVVAAPDVTAVLGDFVANIGDERVVLIESDDPTRTARRYSDAVAVTIEATGDLAPECYALRSDTTKAADAGFHAVGGDVLGAQYALADALEQRGYGFYHPEETVIPADLAASPWSPGVGAAPSIVQNSRSGDWTPTPCIPSSLCRTPGCPALTV